MMSIHINRDGKFVVSFGATNECVYEKTFTQVLVNGVKSYQTDINDLDCLFSCKDSPWMPHFEDTFIIYENDKWVDEIK